MIGWWVLLIFFAGAAPALLAPAAPTGVPAPPIPSSPVYVIVDFENVPTGMTLTLKSSITNPGKKKSRIVDYQIYGDGFSANTDNCMGYAIPARSSCSIYFTFDSGNLYYGAKTGFVQISLANGTRYEFTLKAKVTRALETPLGDREAEDFFSARIPDGTKKLSTLLKTKVITQDDFNKGLTALSDLRQQVFSYAQKLYLECRGPIHDPDFLDDSAYAYRLRYIGGILKKLIINSTADFSEVTPEVTDFIPARQGCHGKADQILKCTRKNIDDRIAAIYTSINQHNPGNPTPYRACADLGVQSAKTYASLSGILRHKSATNRAQETLDIEDKMVGLTFQDLDEGY